jgi:hypothetical protein
MRVQTLNISVQGLFVKCGMMAGYACGVHAEWKRIVQLSLSPGMSVGDRPPGLPRQPSRLPGPLGSSEAESNGSLSREEAFRLNVSDCRSPGNDVANALFGDMKALFSYASTRTPCQMC